jgi:hypothetical protein
LKRLVELAQRFGNERDVILRVSLVEHEVSPSGSLTSHVATPGHAIRLPSEDAAELVKRGLATYPPRL